jgi:hypothetical protein
VTAAAAPGDINLIPHFGPLHGALIQGNYLGANIGSSFCTYGGAGVENPADHIQYRLERLRADSLGSPVRGLRAGHQLRLIGSRQRLAVERLGKRWRGCSGELTPCVRELKRPRRCCQHRPRADPLIWY